MSTRRLFIGNLPYSATESDVMMHFADYQPHSVRVMADRGFAFLDVDESRWEEAVEKMDGSDLKGRALKVSEARPREDRPRPSYGGGGGGGGGYNKGPRRDGGGGGGGYGGGRGGRDSDRRGGGNRW